ncbi:MAG: hypothetical protein ISR91_02580 [Candidatus Delongbacteria bacterium]|nr:hypothetical protein [bacterium]MBL7033007.1 hypothetical protein [Candidatus Delongbacteria bacterium]
MESQDSEFSSQDNQNATAANRENQSETGFLALAAAEDLSIPEIAWLEATFLSRSLPWLELIRDYISSPRKKLIQVSSELSNLIATRRGWLQELSENYPADPETARERRIAIRCLNFLADWDNAYPDLAQNNHWNAGRKIVAQHMPTMIKCEQQRLDFLDKVVELKTTNGLELHQDESRLQLEQLQSLFQLLEAR